MMKTNHSWILAAAVGMALTGVTGVSFGQAVPGAGAEDKEASPPTTEPGADQKPARPKMADLVSPDAAKTLDDQDLLNKLTGKGNADSGAQQNPEEKMNEVKERMGQSEARLEKQRDPGPVTQEIQSRIIIDLDAMIEMFKQAQSKSQSKPDEGSKPGEARKETKTEQTEKKEGSQAATNDDAPRGAASPFQSNGEGLNELRQGWGGLPPQDRDSVTNGAMEKYLPSYREQITEYYKALAELGKSTKER